MVAAKSLEKYQKSRQETAGQYRQYDKWHCPAPARNACRDIPAPVGQENRQTPLNSYYNQSNVKPGWFYSSKHHKSGTFCLCRETALVNIAPWASTSLLSEDEDEFRFHRETKALFWYRVPRTFFYLLQKVSDLCKTVFVAFLGKGMFGTLENKSLFFHDLTDSRFAQESFQFSCHMCAYSSNCPDGKWISQVSGIGFDSFDKTATVFGRSYYRPAFSRFVVKTIETIRLEAVEPIVNTLLIASEYFRNLWYRIALRAKPYCLRPFSETVVRAFKIQVFYFLMLIFGQFSYKSLWPHADVLSNPLSLRFISVEPQQTLKTFYR
jgi:hypothetical protein